MRRPGYADELATSLTAAVKRLSTENPLRGMLEATLEVLTKSLKVTVKLDTELIQKVKTIIESGQTQRLLADLPQGHPVIALEITGQKCVFIVFDGDKSEVFDLVTEGRIVVVPYISDGKVYGKGWKQLVPFSIPKQEYVEIDQITGKLEVNWSTPLGTPRITQQDHIRYTLGVSTVIGVLNGIHYGKAKLETLPEFKAGEVVFTWNSGKVTVTGRKPPKEHLRVGHLRKLTTGKIVTVRPATVSKT